MSKIGIVGAGAWGTALAAAMIRAGNEVTIQAHEAEVADAINKRHENEMFFAGVALDPAIRATAKLAEAIDAEAVLLAAPAQHMRAVTEAAAPDWRRGVPAVICAKGIEQGSCALMSEVVAETVPGVPIAVLSGPTFAAEVAADKPTAVTLACNDELIGKVLMETLSSRHFRIYRTRDVIGAQMGGAVKNVLAIACGIVEGRKLGDNTRAALVTRGLAEITRLGAAKGARPETLAGLSGLGDLSLTCNAMQSRNFSLGVALGEGISLEEVLGQRNSVAEGVFTASSVTDLARRLDIEAPICVAVDGVLNHFADIDATIAGLLSRPLKEETA
ncbi:MAG: NAD(P)H-dependent glycerol-3-phosphate dehydrogenase [Rhodospirillales bacterium]|jgi:glycerol-3-phosphate dehydrogenase (NAD(P)+)|nr:NAD(P)H-dependent glycerol-3-phosphate dehydrogenase [Rhodospirillales bacterium]MDP6644495.1 NAD(P)H-dependent glycerol-3-phosphate dehydrogenase [Rhodospirillales bacterium]MDP6840222.1 NAD(P)H-dependent glycerol-3-phosphate dehydrogenase [Rhodospirillales bacterium]